jgi:hypothetical protein
VCRLCYGSPVAAIRVVYEPDPNGPGYRKTGEYYLMDDDDNRVTDELRCRECGMEAIQIHLMSSADIGSKPKGRRVCVG